MRFRVHSVWNNTNYNERYSNQSILLIRSNDAREIGKQYLKHFLNAQTCTIMAHQILSQFNVFKHACKKINRNKRTLEYCTFLLQLKIFGQESYTNTKLCPRIFSRIYSLSVAVLYMMASYEATCLCSLNPWSFPWHCCSSRRLCSHRKRKESKSL